MRRESVASLAMMEKGFTLVEILIVLAIISVLSAIGLSFGDLRKKARSTEINTHLSTAARKLQVLDLELSEEECLKEAELQDSNNFFYSCTKRDDGGTTFDILMKPLGDYGVGGVLSFDLVKNKTCWDSCDATGFGEAAQLSVQHLDLSNNCSAATRKETQEDCNCNTTTVKECLYPNGKTTKPKKCPLCGLFCCKGWDKKTCTSKPVTTCDKCTVVSYTSN